MVQIKRKVTIKRKNSSQNVWIWVVICFLILLLITFLFFKGCNKEGEEKSQIIEETVPSLDDTLISPNKTIDIQDTSPKLKEGRKVEEEEKVASTEERIEKPTIQSATHKNKFNGVNEDIESYALRVIRGEFGNGQIRKDKLGDTYIEIQKRVNEMYRQGLVQ